MSATPITHPATATAAASTQSTAALSAWGFLILRLAVGAVFVMHGWQKLTVMGVGGVAGFFGSLGIPFPEVAALVVTLVELVGGLALILGLGTRLAGALLAINMLVALLLVHLPNGFAVENGGYEFVLVLLAASIFFALSGPGRLSLDARLLARRLPHLA